MKSKHIIITGTSRGIGYELVKLFAAQGHCVLALSRNQQPISKLQLQNVTTFSFDLSDPDAYSTVELYVRTEWHGQVDVLINNAAALLNTSIKATTQEEYQKKYRTVLLGV